MTKALTDLNNYFGDLVSVGTKPKPSKLPTLVDNIVSDVLAPINPKASIASLVLITITKLAEVAAFKRVQVSNGEGLYYPANVYAINFLESGAGKNKPITDMEAYVLPGYKAEFINTVNKFLEDTRIRLEQEAVEKYPSSVAQQKEYIRDSMPTRINRVFGKGSYEGVIAQREALASTNFGGTFLLISEFSRFIRNQTLSDSQFFDFYSELFDTGSHDAKVTKGNKNAVDVTGVPANAIFHTAYRSLLEGDNREKLDSLLVDGLARRSFMAFSQRKQVEDSDDILAEIRNRRVVLDMTTIAKPIREYIDDVLSTVYFNVKLTLTEDAELELAYYNKWLEFRIAEYKPHEVIEAEMNGRSWKVRKLAGVLSIFNHPSTSIVDVQDVREAMYLGELFGAHLTEFFATKTPLESDKLYQFLREQDRWITKTEIARQQFVAKNRFSQWIGEGLAEVAELAQQDGYKLESRPFAKNGREYRLSLLRFADKTPDELLSDPEFLKLSPEEIAKRLSE